MREFAIWTKLHWRCKRESKSRAAWRYDLALKLAEDISKALSTPPNQALF